MESDECMGIEEKLRESEEKYRLLFENANDGIILLNNMIIVDYNRRAGELFGCPNKQLLGTSAERFIPPVQEDGRITSEILHEKRERILQGEPQLFEIGLCRMDGSQVDVELSLNLICFRARQMMLVIVRDITERKKMQEWLRYLNLYDKATGLFNRNHFEEKMELMDSGRYDPVGVIVCDVDGLKLVNDNLGHDTGDMVLATAAKILTECFRNTDIIARIGGDEFAVLLPDCPPERVKNACARIQAATAASRRANPPIPLSLSVGWAIKQGRFQEMKNIFKVADDCMYKQKPHNRKMFREFFYDHYQVKPADQ